MQHAPWILQDHSKRVWWYANWVQELHKVWVKQLIFLFRKYYFFLYHTLNFGCSWIFLNLQTRKWKSFNTTFARGHAWLATEVSTRLIQNSQAGILTKKMTILPPHTNSSTLGGESLSPIRKSGLVKDAARYTKRLKQTSLICIIEDCKVTLWCQLMRLRESTRWKQKPSSTTFSTLPHPPMKSFLTQNAPTIYSNYVVPINIATTSEPIKYFGLLPGKVTILFDGVTVNRKSKVRWLLT